MSLLAKLREQRAAKQAELEQIVGAVEARNETKLSDTEQTKFNEIRAAIVGTTDDDGNMVEQGLDARIAELVDLENRAEAAARAAGDKSPVVKVRSEPLTYQRHSGDSGYFRDLALATLRADSEALGRLQRHAAEMDVEWKVREEKRAAAADRELRNLPDGAEAFFGRETRTNPNRTDGQGGYFVPPLWLVDEFIPLIRAGRVFANSVRQMGLPAGTDSINIPKVSVGSSTNVQTADGAGVTSQDMTDTFVTAPVRTIAGQQDVAMQLLDQSPINISDQVVFPDLLADYNRRVDLQCLSGSGANGQMTGIDNVSSVNTVTYTDASPTGPELYVPLAQAASQVAGNRLLPPTAYFFHTRRWFWLASQLDGSNRPLVVPTSNGPFNAEALQLGVAAEGPVGNAIGMPILMDPNITTTDNTNQDRIYSVRTSDLYLFEGTPRTRVLQEVLSGTLQIRFQLYNYTAFMANRYPSSISIVSGTGLAAPSGF